MPLREEHKKHDDEMLIVHKPGAKAEPSKAGRAAAEVPRVAALDKQELDLLKQQISMTRDPSVRRELVARIQSKFGNEKATEVVQELRHAHPDDAVSVKKAPTKGGKGKA